MCRKLLLGIGLMLMLGFIVGCTNTPEADVATSVEIEVEPEPTNTPAPPTEAL